MPRHFFSMIKFSWVVLLSLMLIAGYVFKSHLHQIINQLASMGAFTPWGFLLLYSFTSIFCLPTVLVALAGGVLFGPVSGTCINLLGATLGAAASFCLSRYFRVAQGISFKQKRVQRLIALVEHQGWKAVAWLRLTPMIPFNLVNYALGFTRIKLSHFLLATFIFIIPSRVIVTLSGYYGWSFLD